MSMNLEFRSKSVPKLSNLHNIPNLLHIRAFYTSCFYNLSSLSANNMTFCWHTLAWEASAARYLSNSKSLASLAISWYAHLRFYAEESRNSKWLQFFLNFFGKFGKIWSFGKLVLYESLINNVPYINTLYTDFKDKFMNEAQAASEIKYCVVGTTFDLELALWPLKKYMEWMWEVWKKSMWHTVLHQLECFSTSHKLFSFHALKVSTGCAL